MTPRVTESAEETEALGAEVAKDLKRGDVVLLSGDVGTGKSTLVRGAARALGVTEPVQSPTYTIGRRYPVAGGLAVSHLDLYRLADLGLEEPGLLDDYLTADAISFIEWPEVGADALARDGVAVARRITLRHAGGDRREIEVSAPAAARTPAD